MLSSLNRVSLTYLKHDQLEVEAMTVYQVCLHLSSSNTQPKQVVNDDGRGSRATGVPTLVGKKDPHHLHCV